MKEAAKIFNAITIILIIILIFWLTQLNYNDLSFKENSNAYFGMFSIGLMIYAIQLIKSQNNKNNPDK